MVLKLKISVLNFLHYFEEIVLFMFKLKQSMHFRYNTGGKLNIFRSIYLATSFINIYAINSKVHTVVEIVIFIFSINILYF